MALKAEAKEKLKTMGIDVDALIAAVTAATEVDYIVPEGLIVKQSDLELRDANKLAEGKRAGMTEGEAQGKELAAKAIKKKFGIEDPTKEIDKVVDLVNAKVATGDTGLKEQVALLLNDKEQLTAKVAEVQSKAEAASFDTQLITMFPANRTADLNDGERLTLVKSALSFETVDGKRVTKRNGEILRDPTTQNPIEPAKAITDYFNERKWIGGAPGGGGRGGVDNPGGSATGSPKKYSEAESQWVAENPGKSANTVEFHAYLDTVAKENKDFDFNS